MTRNTVSGLNEVEFEIDFEAELDNQNGQDDEIADESDALRMAMNEERFDVHGLDDGVEAIDAEYDGQEDAEGVETLLQVVAQDEKHQAR